MVLLYFTLCYFMSISHTSSYVLIAANVDDFRTLAKKFMPESVAEKILTLSSNINQRAAGGDDPNQSNNEHEYSQPGEGKDYIIKAKDKILKTKHELNLEDIVEEIKNRLRKELASMGSKSNKKKKQKHIPDREKKDKLSVKDYLELDKITTPVMNQTRYVKQSRNDKENENNGNKRNLHKKKPLQPAIQDSRYVAELFIAPSPKDYLPKDKKITSFRPKKYPKQPNYQGQMEQETHQSLHISNQNNTDNTQQKELQERQEKNHKNQRQLFELKQANHIKQLTTTEKKYRKRTKRKSTTNDENIISYSTHNNENLLFERIDMANKNDSYEDYVIPKPDDSSDEKPRPKLNKDNNVDIPSQVKNTLIENHDVRNDYFQEGEGITSNHVKKNKVVFKDDDLDRYKFTDNTDHKNKDSIFEADDDRDIKNYMHKKKRFDVQKESIDNYNKAKRQRDPNLNESPEPTPVPSESVLDLDQSIQPYAQQLIEITTENYDETQVTATEEPKARTENLISEEEYDLKSELPLDKLNAKMVTTKKNTKRLPKGGTVIPKRDFYKFSSPNYLAKLPIVAEKYRFDEPIPEQDREPEMLKPVGNPPASINKKVLLL